MADEATNTGHGHVFPRPDKVRARCGGPTICAECARDFGLKKNIGIDQPAPQGRQRENELGKWVRVNFGEDALFDKKERALRVLEEAIELADACGVDQLVALHLVNRCYRGPTGDPMREAAQVGTTLFAWASGQSVNLLGLVDAEIARLQALPKSHWVKRQNAKADEQLGIRVKP